MTDFHTGLSLRRLWSKIDTSAMNAWAGLKARLQRTTVRERVLLACLAMGMVIYAPVAALEYRTVQAEAYVNALSDQASARLTLNTARRIAAGAADQMALEDMKSWGFEASNAAVAQTLIEHRLVEATQAAGMTGSTITTSQNVEAIGPTQWMAVEVQADLRWTSTFAFLDHLGEWPEGFRVTSFRYQLTPSNPLLLDAAQTGPLGKVQIGLSFPVRLPSEAVAS